MNDDLARAPSFGRGSRAFAVWLPALILLGCDSRNATPPEQIRVRVLAETLIVNGSAPVRLPIRFESPGASAAPLTGFRLRLSADSTVRAADSTLTCLRRGDLKVTVLTMRDSAAFLLRCRPIKGFYLQSVIELRLGGPSASAQVYAVGANGTPEPLLRGTASTRDSGIVAIHGDTIHPLSVGRATIRVDFGGTHTNLWVAVRERIVADTVRLRAGEFRRWELNAGRFEVAVRETPETRKDRTLDMVTDGLSCAPDAADGDRIHCAVRGHGTIALRNREMAGDRRKAVAFVSIERVP